MNYTRSPISKANRFLCVLASLTVKDRLP